MINGTLYVDKFYLNDRIFDLQDPISNRDNCLYGYYLLKNKFRQHGINLSTQDINRPEDSQFVIYSDMPKKLGKINNKCQYLILFESEVVKKVNWNEKYHNEFKKIFTWNDNYIDNIKYFKINFSHKIEKVHPTEIDQNKKLCTMIAGNKQNSHAKELYSERINAIRWFENNYPDDFDLYGFGWDEYRFRDKLSLLNYYQLKPLRKLIGKKYPSYMGAVESKQNTLKKYKFSLCYENAIDIPGYITEKIFDCFFAECIPIYLGANNVCEHIPANTFIDKRDFKTYEELYLFLSQMPNDEYCTYIKNIRNFIKSNKIYFFSAEYFANTLIDQILMDV